MLKSPRISVIVCTRNRSELLTKACNSILAVEPPKRSWEMVIVDNMSTDDSLDIAHRIAAQNPNRVRVIQEAELGLSAARNAGVRATQSEILVFIDDDAFPQPSWLRGLEEALEMDRVYACGGPIDPLIEGELPDWVGKRYLPYLSAWDPGSEILDLAYNEYPRGANMAFRREVFERFGFFSHHLGRRGKSLRSCEETELCLRVERGGYRVLYTPKARVSHMVTANRVTEPWLLDRFAAQGTSEAIIDWQHGGLAGLRVGYERFHRYAVEARRDTGPGSDLFRRCQDRSWKAYSKAALFCPWTVRRWKPSPEVGPIASWLPFA